MQATNGFLQASTWSERHHTVTIRLLRHNTVVFSTWTHGRVSNSGLFWKQHIDEGCPSGWRWQWWIDGIHLSDTALEDFIGKLFFIITCTNSSMIPDLANSRGDAVLFSTLQFLPNQDLICTRLFCSELDCSLPVYLLA